MLCDGVAEATPFGAGAPIDPGAEIRSERPPVEPALPAAGTFALGVIINLRKSAFVMLRDGVL